MSLSLEREFWRHKGLLPVLSGPMGNAEACRRYRVLLGRMRRVKTMEN